MHGHGLSHDHLSNPKLETWGLMTRNGRMITQVISFDGIVCSSQKDVFKVI